MNDSVVLKNKKILITGPTGQVAFPIAQALAVDNEVYGLARFRKEKHIKRVESIGVIPIKADLAEGDLNEVPTDVDYVLNFAVVKTQDFDYDLAANAEGVGRLMLHCKAMQAFLHCSSTAVFQYAGHVPLHESSPFGDNHRWMFPTYSIGKIAAETVVRFTAHQFNIPTTIARLCVPYGNNGGWPYFHLMMMQQGMPIPVHPEHPNIYNLLHSDDYIAHIPKLLAAASCDVTTLNWGGPQVSIEEWCAYLTELTGIEASFEENPQAFGSLYIDPTRMNEIVGSKHVEWRQGILNMVRVLAPELLKAEYRA